MSKLKTMNEIRRANLQLLIKESKQAGEGGAKSVAEKCGTTASYLSQIITRFVFPNGKCKEVGSGLARKLEIGCGKPVGWMDTPHDSGEYESSGEDEIIALYLAMNNEMQAAFLNQARAIVKMGSEN